MPSNEPFRPWLFVPEIVYPYDPRLRPLPPPDTGIFDCPQVQVCINSKWVSHLDGLIERLLFRDAWEADETEIDRATGEIAKLLAALKVDNMSCCCGTTGTLTRYNEDGILEISTDGGATWTPAPQLDPRFNSPIFLPLPGADGDDKKCAAAASVMETLKQDIIAKLNTATAGNDVLGIIVAIIALFISVPTGGALYPLLMAVAYAIFGFGISATQAAFTQQVWDDFQCILYCRMDDNASFTTAQWEAVKSDCNNQFLGIVQTVLYGTVNAFGPAGLTNAARSGRVAIGTPDCALCDCPDCSYLITFDASNWQEYTVNFGTVSSARLNVVTHEFPLGPGYGSEILIDLQQLCQIDFIACDFLAINQRPGNALDIFAIFYDAEMTELGGQGFTSSFTADGVEHHGSSPVPGFVARYVSIHMNWLNTHGEPNSGWIDNIALNAP